MARLAHGFVVARVVVVAFLVLVATALRADAESTSAPDARIASALFTPTRVEDGIEWRVHWILTPDAAEDVARGNVRTLRFALPLTADEWIEPSFGIAPLQESGEGGRVIGALIDRASLDGRQVSAVVHQRIGRPDAPRFHVGAPIAAGSAVQIIDGDLGSSTRLAIDTGRIFERRVGYLSAAGVGQGPREDAQRLTGYVQRVNGAAIYLRGDDVKAMSGLSASLEGPRARGHQVAVATALVFGGLVVVMVVALRRVRHAASVERADALLAAEVDALDASHRGDL